MDDIIHTQGDWRYIIYETNKAPRLGYVKWVVERYYPEFDYWTVEKSSDGYMTLDVAMRQAHDTMNYCRNMADRQANDNDENSIMINIVDGKRRFEMNTNTAFLALRPDEMIHLSEVPYDQDPGYAVMAVVTPPFLGASHAEGAQLAIVCIGQYTADEAQSNDRLWGWVHLEASTKEIVGHALATMQATPGRWYYMLISGGLGNRPRSHFDVAPATAPDGTDSEEE